MGELPISIKKAASRYKMIEADGLKLYPVAVKNYDDFLIAKPALEVLHQSLPVAMMRMPLLSALYQMDFEAACTGQQIVGLFSRALLMLSLALRLGEGKPTEERTRSFQISVDPAHPETLKRLSFSDDDGNQHEITPVQYARLREIIAAQNGVKLESDKANPDIVKAAKDKASLSELQLDANIDDWILAVSALSGYSEDDIDEWPILKFQRRSESYKRILDYIICGVGECSGTTWKGGNPTPHPYFAKLQKGSGILTELGGRADGNKSAPPRAATAIQEITKKL